MLRFFLLAFFLTLLMPQSAFALEGHEINKACGQKAPTTAVAAVTSSSYPSVLGTSAIVLQKTSETGWLISVRHFSLKKEGCVTLIEFEANVPVEISPGGQIFQGKHLDDIWRGDIKRLERRCERKNPSENLKDLRSRYTVIGTSEHLAPIDVGSFVGCHLLARSVIGSALIKVGKRQFHLTSFMGKVKLSGR